MTGQQMKRNGLLAVTAIFFLGLGYGLGTYRHQPANFANAPGQTETGKQREVVLTVGDYGFDYEEIRKFLFNRLHTTTYTREAVEKRLDRLIFQELLYQEALSRGMENDPQVRSKFRQLTADRLLRDTFQSKLNLNEVSQKEIRDYYDQHQSQFHREKQIRTADIFVSADVKNAEQKARNLLAKAKKTSKRRAGFGQLIKRSSDTPPYFLKGNSGFFDQSGNLGQVPREYVQAAFSLKKIGDIHPNLIQTESGYHIVMLIGRRSEFHRSLPAVKNQIKAILETQRKSEIRESFAQQLKQKYDVAQTDELLARLMEEADTRVARQLSPPAFPNQQH